MKYTANDLKQLARDLGPFLRAEEMERRIKSVMKTWTVPAPEQKWTDGYGVTRTAREMTTEHLFNVMGYIRDRMKLELPTRTKPPVSSFYWSAVEELKRRGQL